jgi:hypothetical protein
MEAAEALSKLSTMNDQSSFVKDPIVITKQFVITNLLYKLYFNNFVRPQLCQNQLLCEHGFTQIDSSTFGGLSIR